MSSDPLPRVETPVDAIVGVMGNTAIPRLAVFLPWWRRLEIACGILFRGSAALPEASANVIEGRDVA